MVLVIVVVIVAVATALLSKHKLTTLQVQM